MFWLQPNLLVVVIVVLGDGLRLCIHFVNIEIVFNVSVNLLELSEFCLTIKKVKMFSRKIILRLIKIMHYHYHTLVSNPAPTSE